MEHVGGILGFLKRPAVIVAITALAVRLVLVPLFTYDFDIEHWAQTITNIQTGDGLYGVDGYYYTPTWGYILAFLSEVMDVFGLSGTFGIRFTELLPIEGLSFQWHTANTMTIGFAVCMKIPLIIVDLACGYLIHRIIREDTGNGSKATFGLALWLFCPTIVYMSGVQCMFDSVSALLLLLTFMLLRSDRELLAGMTFAAGVLLKFFPAFSIIVLVGYIAAKHRGDGRTVKRIAASVIGAMAMALAMYLPIILDGDLETSLSFIFGRTSGMDALTMIGQCAVIAIALLGMVVFGYLMLKTPGGDADRKFPVFMLLAMTCAVTMSPTPQYMIVMMPFLIVVMMECDGRLRLPWLLISVGTCMITVANNNFMLLDGASVFLNLVSPDWVVSVSEAFDAFLGEGTVRMLANLVGEALEYIGFIAIVLICCEGAVRRLWPKLADALDKLKRWNGEREAF